MVLHCGTARTHAAHPGCWVCAQCLRVAGAAASTFASNEYGAHRAQTREKAMTISKLAANAVVLVERRANGHRAAKKVLAKSGTKSRGISGDFPPGLRGKSDPISGDFPSSGVRSVNSQRCSKASAHFGEK